MKQRIALLLVAASTAFGAAAVAPAAESWALTPAASAKPCSSGWAHGVIGGEHKCLRAGQFCVRRYDGQYHRYGYHCHRYDASVGRHRLTR